MKNAWIKRREDRIHVWYADVVDVANRIGLDHLALTLDQIRAISRLLRWKFIDAKSTPAKIRILLGVSLLL